MPSGADTQTDTQTDARTKVISRNQAMRTWFNKNYYSEAEAFKCIVTHLPTNPYNLNAPTYYYCLVILL